MHAERVWLLLAKREAGEATEAELEELIALLAEWKDSAGYEVLEKVWQAPLQSLPDMKPGTDLWNRIDQRIKQPEISNLSFNKAWWMAAAVMAGIAGLFFLYEQHPSYLSKQASKTVSTESHSKKHVVLSDGTRVWLNGNSKLDYKTGFGGKSREVKLEGEAFFDVTKDEGHPFIIHVANVIITVKGAAFNVKGYPEQKQVETSLIRGLIEITTVGDPERKILLKPEEKIIIPAEVLKSRGHPAKARTHDIALFTITRLEKDEHDVLPETVWMNKSLSFDNEPLEQLVPKLESWFAVVIHVDDAALKGRRFSGEITGETIAQTLEAFKLSYPFSYRIDNDEVWITR